MFELCFLYTFSTYENVLEFWNLFIIYFSLCFDFVLGPTYLKACNFNYHKILIITFQIVLIKRWLTFKLKLWHFSPIFFKDQCFHWHINVVGWIVNPIFYEFWLRVFFNIHMSNFNTIFHDHFQLVWQIVNKSSNYHNLL